MKNYRDYENDELRLRKLKPKDLELMINWHNDSPKGKRYIYNKPCNMDSQKKWYSNYQKNSNHIFFIAEEKMSLNIPIGVVSIHIHDDNNVEFDKYWIGEKLARDKGYGIKIMYLIQDFIFKEIGAKYSFLQVYCDNRPAVNTYIKAGYKIADLMEKDGRDMYYMRAVNKERYF